MAKRNAAAAQIPIGGNQAKVDAPHLEAETVEWGKEDSPTEGAAVAELKESMPDADARAAKVAALLGRSVDPAATEEAEKEPAAEEPPAEEAKPEPPKPSRKDLMANIASEKQRLGLEQTLKTERAERERLEKLVKSGSALQLLQARGMSREAALQELLENPEVAEDATPPEKNPEVEELKTKVSQMEADNAAKAMKSALAYTESATKDLDVPLVRAAKKIPVPTDNGGVRMVSGHQLVMETAYALSREAGDADNPAIYLKQAAELVEEQLAEEHKELLEAYEAKRGKKPAEKEPEEKKQAAPPALGKRMTGGTNKVVPGGGLPRDADERRQAVKERFGW